MEGLLAELRMRLSAVTKAIRTAGRMKGGTSCNVGTGHRDTRSTASSVTQAVSGTPAKARVRVLGRQAHRPRRLRLAG